MSSLELNAQRFDKKGEYSFSFVVRYAGPSFIEISQGSSLSLIIDGKRIEFSGKGSEGHRNIISIGLVEEVAYYHNIEPSVFRKIAEAEKIDVEVRCTTTPLTRHFNSRNFTRFQEFCDRYLLTAE